MQAKALQAKAQDDPELKHMKSQAGRHSNVISETSAALSSNDLDLDDFDDQMNQDNAATALAFMQGDAATVADVAAGQVAR